MIRLLLLSFLVVGAMSCVGSATTSITLPSSRYQVSMSSYQIIQGKIHETDASQIVGKFETSFESWALVYGLASFSPQVDLSDALNQQIEAAGGNSVVNFHIEGKGCSINAAPIVSILPIWPSCISGKVVGDIVRAPFCQSRV